MKVKNVGWSAATKVMKTKVGSETINFKASSSMMARLLVITRSSCDIDLKEVIGKHESHIDDSRWTTSSVL